MIPSVNGKLALIALLTTVTVLLYLTFRFHRVTPSLKKKNILRVSISNHERAYGSVFSDDYYTSQSDFDGTSDITKQGIPRKDSSVEQFKFLDHEETLLVYSAHYDPRVHLIKIVGFKSKVSIATDVSVSCRYEDGSKCPMRDLHNVSLIEYRPKILYDTWVWVCDCINERPPSTVTLVSEHNSIPLRIRNYEPGKTSNDAMICVRPLTSNYNDSYQLKEFIEVNRALGVEKIALYLNSINSAVIEPVLEHYQHQGIVDVHQWKLPVDEDSVHVTGQKTHNQHCFYTYMTAYKWIAFIDLDEIVVPSHNFTSLIDMLKHAESIHKETKNSQVGGLNLRSQMCPTALPDDKVFHRLDDGLCYFTSLRKTNCTLPMDIGVWSKPIANTAGAEVVDVHSLRETINGTFAVYDLDPEVGSIHHFRNNMTGCLIVKLSPKRNIRKTNLHKFMTKLKGANQELCNLKNPHAF